jgi:hypothetical protein
MSDRTVSRWLGGAISVLLPDKLHALARSVFANDPALAAELAGFGNTTLEALGLVRAPSAPAPAVAASQPPLAPPTANAQAPQAVSVANLDSIVCAAADLHDLPSRQVRPMVAAAFARAVELGITAEAAARAFAANDPKKG